VVAKVLKFPSPLGMVKCDVCDTLACVAHPLGDLHKQRLCLCLKHYKVFDKAVKSGIASGRLLQANLTIEVARELITKTKR